LADFWLIFGCKLAVKAGKKAAKISKNQSKSVKNSQNQPKSADLGCF
jgi:hypothetical protein